MKRLALLVVALSLSGIVSACSKGGSSQQSKTADTGEVPHSTEPAEIVFVSNSGDSPESFDTRFGNALRKKFPHLTITYLKNSAGQKIPELIASQSPIDIYWESVGQFVNGLIKNQLQYDMTDLIKKYKVDLNRFEPTTIDAMRSISDGKMYALPVSNNNLSLFYNKDLFDKFNVPYPKDGMTWDDVIDLNKKLTRNDNGKPYVGLGYSHQHLFRLNYFSLPFLDPKTEKTTINTDPRWKMLYQVMMDAAKAPGYKAYIDAKKLPDTEAKFLAEQQVGMYLYQSYMFFTKDMSTINWDMVSAPTFKELPGVGSQAYPTYFALANTSKHKEQAMEVIAYLVSDEFQMELSRMGVMPTVTKDEIKKAFGQGGPIKDKNLQAVFKNKFAPISTKTIYDTDIEGLYRNPLQDLLTEKTDINTVFRGVEEQVNKFVETAKSAAPAK